MCMVRTSACTCVNKSVRVFLCTLHVCPTGMYTKVCVHACLRVHVLWCRAAWHTSKLKSLCLGNVLFVGMSVCVLGQSAAGRGLIE